MIDDDDDDDDDDVRRQWEEFSSNPHVRMIVRYFQAVADAVNRLDDKNVATTEKDMRRIVVHINSLAAGTVCIEDTVNGMPGFKLVMPSFESREDGIVLCTVIDDAMPSSN